MNNYEYRAVLELEKWKATMQRPPSLINRATKGTQKRINRIIPEKIHKVVTTAIKQMTRAVIFGSRMTTFSKSKELTLEQIELKALKSIKIYRSTAAVEGGVTGFGGFLSGMADLPLWLAIKIKMLFQIAANYGIDVKDYKERVYILHIFQLTFSSQQHRNKVFEIMSNWENHKEQLPNDINDFDWRTFQLEYRDYIDLAKLLQLIPGVGAIIGAFVNYRLTNKLGKNAMNAYRLRRKMLIKELSLNSG